MEDVLKQAAEYERSYTIVGRAHYVASDQFAGRSRWLSIPVVIISTVVGTTIFGTLNENPDPIFRIAAGLLSLFGAVLAALETTFGYAQMAERHKAAAARYRAIRRRLKTFRLKYSDASSHNRAEALTELEALNKELEAISAESPSIPDACYDRAVRDYDLEQQHVSQTSV